MSIDFFLSRRVGAGGEGEEKVDKEKRENGKEVDTYQRNPVLVSSPCARRLLFFPCREIINRAAARAPRPKLNAPFRFLE